MTTEEYSETYNLGQFHALIHSLAGPCFEAASAANRTYAAASKVEVSGADAQLMVKVAEKMEEAASFLRKAAEKAKPTLRLMAAE